MLKYFDSHCHIQFEDFDRDRFEVIERMKAEGIGGLVVGTNAEMSAEAVEATTLWSDGLWAVVGAHPTEAVNDPLGGSGGANFRALLQNDKVVGVGECGLDYFRRDKNDKERQIQRELFEAQVDLAIEHNLPLVLHCRPSTGTMDAYEDVLEILRSRAREAGERVRGNAHFFVGSVEIARQFLELGFTIAFPGVITFARDYDDVIRYAPLDMILAETDTPFAAPVPYRGKRNEPAYVKEVVQKIAEIRGGDEEVVRQTTVENVMRVFVRDSM